VIKKEKKEKAAEPEETMEGAKDDDLEEKVLFFTPPSEGPEDIKLRLLSLYGEVDEEKAADITYALRLLKETCQVEEPEDPTNPDSEMVVIKEPIEFIISTYGGSAAEMFAIYDTMRMIREECEIHTIGLGKVMSAGVLLLAAGTKGKRKVAKNCRIMLHSVIGGSAGAIYNLENEMEEIRFTQKQHIECLVEETTMTRSYLKKLLNKKVNVYLTAKEAVKLGIADEII